MNGGLLSQIEYMKAMCQYISSDGKRCKAKAMVGSNYCIAHGTRGAFGREFVARPPTGAMPARRRKIPVRTPPRPQLHQLLQPPQPQQQQQQSDPNDPSTFKVIKVLGTGTYGEVKLVEHPVYGRVAWKTMELSEAVQEEANILEYLSDKGCPWNIRLYGHTVDDGIVNLYLEYFDGYELGNVKLDISKREDFDKWIFLAEELTQAVQCLHKNGVVHRDIKLQNIMFDDKQLKILDFGMACKIDKCPLVSMGSPYYFSPQLKERGVNRSALMAVDVWAFAVVLFNLAYGVQLFRDFTRFVDVKKTLADFADGWISMKDYFPPGGNEQVKQIILKLLDSNAAKRVKYFQDGLLSELKTL